MLIDTVQIHINWQYRIYKVSKGRVNNYKYVRRIFKMYFQQDSQKGWQIFLICADKQITEVAYLRHSGEFQFLAVLYSEQDHSGSVISDNNKETLDLSRSVKLPLPSTAYSLNVCLCSRHLLGNIITSLHYFDQIFRIICSINSIFNHLSSSEKSTAKLPNSAV